MWFKADTGHFLFNTGIDLMRKHFTGLMVIKPQEADAYRVIFITEVGLKIFDLEFFPDQPEKVHYMMEAMNRKSLVSALTNDISMVLMNRLPQAQPEILGKKGSGDIIYRYQSGKKNYYYFVREAGARPYFARQTAGLASKARAEMYGSSSTGIDSIKIRHDHFRFSIALYRINENNHAAE